MTRAKVLGHLHATTKKYCCNFVFRFPSSDYIPNLYDTENLIVICKDGQRVMPASNHSLLGPIGRHGMVHQAGGLCRAMPKHFL